MRIQLDSTGSLAAVWDDRLAGLLKVPGAQFQISRASHVEPTADGRWTADLGPAGGPVLGPFDLRTEALAREVDWLGRKLRDGLQLQPAGSERRERTATNDERTGSP